MPRDDREERRDCGAVLSAEWNSDRAEDVGCKSMKGLGSILMLLVGLSVGLPLSCAFLMATLVGRTGG